MQTPKPQGTPEPVLATEADRLESDLEIHRWKESGGPNRDNEARALRLQVNDKSERFQ
jgi:hypothetical protein